jgi:small subunit ribosomal protein S13
MPRLLGINIPDNKKIEHALPYLYGIGPSNAKVILRSAGVDMKKFAKDLSADELNKIQKVIESSYRVEGDLRREVSQNIKRLREIGAWKGVRHSRRLPLRGRTKTNSRTLRGNVRKTMGSGRKASGEKT